MTNLSYKLKDGLWISVIHYSNGCDMVILRQLWAKLCDLAIRSEGPATTHGQNCSKMSKKPEILVFYLRDGIRDKTSQIATNVRDMTN